MKKLFTILLICFSSVVAKGQGYPINQSLGADSTLVTSKGGLKGRIVNWVFTDTTQANTQRIKDYPGAQIVTSSDTSLWFRSNNMWLKVRSSGSSVPTNDTLAWRVGGNDLATLQKSVNLGTLSADPIKFITNSTIRMVLDENGIIRSSGAANKCVTIDTITKTLYYYDCAAGGGGLQTASNGLTASGSNVKLGGTLVNNTTIDLDGFNFAIVDNSVGYTRLSINPTFSSLYSPSETSEFAMTDAYIKLLGQDSIVIDAPLIRARTLPPTDTTLNVVGITSSGQLVKTLKSSIAATPTLQQVLTAGSTLTGDNDIDADGFQLGLSNMGYFQAQVGSGARQDVLLMDGDLIQLYSASAAANSAISVYPDSIKILPPLGRLKIDTLNYTLSTAGKKIMLRDTATGLVQNIDPALIVATPTLQEVLTAGSTLTGDNTIDADDGNFSINSVNTISIGDTGPNSRLEIVGSNDVNKITLQGAGAQNSISIVPDSIIIHLGGGKINIDTLRQASNMLNKSVMVWDSLTGRWERIIKDSIATGGGGGSQTPWTSNIDGDGFDLSDVDNISAASISNGATKSFDIQTNGAIKFPTAGIGIAGVSTPTAGNQLRLLFSSNTGYIDTYNGSAYQSLELQNGNLIMTSSSNVMNGNGIAMNTRIATDNDANTVFVDGTNDKVGIGTASPSEKFSVSGNLSLETAGNKLKIATGSNASIGVSGAMTAGTITISTTSVTASSKIFLTHASVGGTQGFLSVGTITAGTSFVINSSSATDTGTVNWWIIN